MILDIQFTENTQSFTTNFGEINNVSDGGYERGYEKGYDDGFDDGFSDAYKEEQQKSVDITENCTKEITPDDEMVLSKVTVNVDVPDKSKELENIIDNSDVLEGTYETVEEKVEALIDKAEDENLWYEYTKGANSFSSLFTNSTAEKIPRMNPIKATSMSYMCYGMTNLKRVDFYINTESCTNFNSMFTNCLSLEFVKGVNTSKATSAVDMFGNAYALKTIEKPLDLSSATSANNIMMFRGNGSFALEDVRFEEGSIHWSFYMGKCPYLSAESIQSIIEGLAIGDGSQEIVFHTDIIGKLTDRQWDTIATKNWNVG